MASGVGTKTASRSNCAIGSGVGKAVAAMASQAMPPRALLTRAHRTGVKRPVVRSRPPAHPVLDADGAVAREPSCVRGNLAAGFGSPGPTSLRPSPLARRRGPRAPPPEHPLHHAFVGPPAAGGGAPLGGPAGPPRGPRGP